MGKCIFFVCNLLQHVEVSHELCGGRVGPVGLVAHEHDVGRQAAQPRALDERARAQLEAEAVRAGAERADLAPAQPLVAGPRARAAGLVRQLLLEHAGLRETS